MFKTSQGSAAVLAAAMWIAGAAYAEPAYPQRPIRVIVQFSPGGNVDTAARVIAQQMSRQLGRQMVIDNRAGASGNIAYQTLASAAPDGYTLGIGHIGHLALNPHQLGKLPYDPLKDFAAITRTVDAPNLLVVHPSLPAKNVQELVAYAKANPGKLANGTGGVGTVGHLAGEVLSARAGISLLHVPYKGAAQVIADLIGGQVQMSFGGPPALAPHVSSGKLRALAITTLKRSAAFPELPTVAESGYPGFQAVAWMGLIAPAGVNPKIVSLLNKQAHDALAAREVRDPLARLGFETMVSTPAEFAAFIKSEHAYWGKFIRERGIKAR